MSSTPTSKQQIAATFNEIRKGLASKRLLEHAFKQNNFLKQLHARGVSLQPVSRETARRYELWLELVETLKKRGDEDLGKFALVPPMDVAWCWHCHRLAPIEYAIKGKCPDPPPGSAFSFAKPEDLTNDAYMNFDLRLTLQCWNQMYPDEPFSPPYLTE